MLLAWLLVLSLIGLTTQTLSPIKYSEEYFIEIANGRKRTQQITKYERILLFASRILEKRIQIFE